MIKGGSQTRTLKLVYDFIIYQSKYIQSNKTENTYFINILDGDECFRQKNKFTYLVNKLEKSQFIFIGDMQEFQTWFKSFNK